MAQFTRWFMVGSVVASTLAGPAAEACFLTGCFGGAPRTTFYAPAPMVSAVPNPCNTCDPCATGSCGGAMPTTYAQPTTSLMPVTPVTAYRPLFGGLFQRPQPVSAYLPYTAGYGAGYGASAMPYSAGYSPYTGASPYTVGYTPLAAPAWTTAPYTSYRPVALAPTNYAVPATYSAPVTVQYAPQAVQQAAYYAPAPAMPATTTYMPTTTYAPTAAPVATPGCNCHSSTSTGAASQYWSPSTSAAVVSSTPVSSGAVMTSGANTTFGSTNLGTQSVINGETTVRRIETTAPVQTTPDNVKPIEDPLLKKSSTSGPLTPGRENDPRNKTALVPLVDNSQVAETSQDNAPLVRSLEQLAPYNPVRMTSHVR